MTAEPPRAFLRGCAFPPHAGAPYPRANLDDRRLPADIAAAARVPATVSLAVSGPATMIELSYTAATPACGMRGPSYGTAFAAYPAGGDRPSGRGACSSRCGRVRLPLGPGRDHRVPARGHGAHADRHHGRGRGDSAGTAAAPLGGLRRLHHRGMGGERARPHLAGDGSPPPRRRGRKLRLRRLGRGELVVAEAMAAVPADVITLAFGTNCWGMIAFSEDLVEATVRAFVASVRACHPRTPIVLVSPIVRPDAEATPNRLGATLAGLRAAYERAALSLGAADAATTLVHGRELVAAGQLADGIHPDDDGHAALAAAVGTAVSAALQPPVLGSSVSGSSPT